MKVVCAAAKEHFLHALCGNGLEDKLVPFLAISNGGNG
jgi:hypothetical protein